jgi:hypothetical protein
MSNVVAFAPRRQEAPALRCAELHLDEDCGIQMVLCDDAGNVVATLAYALLASKPGDFDLDRFRRSWNESAALKKASPK